MGVGIKIVGLSKKYHNENRYILDNVNLDILNSKIYCIMGESGTGKSTLLNIIALLDDTYTGKVSYLYNEKECVKHPKVRMMFQKNSLYPWKTVKENIEMGLSHTKIGKIEKNEEIEKNLNYVNLYGMEDRYPFELSGGMYSRVSFICSIISRPDILLLDEPFSALDIVNRKEIQNLFLDFHRKNKFTALMVTHDIEEALKIADYFIIFSKNQNILSVTESENKFKRNIVSEQSERIKVLKLINGVG